MYWFDSLQQVTQYLFLIMMKSGFRAWLMLSKYCQNSQVICDVIAGAWGKKF